MVDRIPDDLEGYYYQEEYFNAGDTTNGIGYAGMYDLMSPGFLLWQNFLIEALVPDHGTKHFLEVGCATGGLLEIIRELQPNLITSGIDISEYAVETARLKGLHAEVAHIESYASKPKNDIIFSAETLEHLDNLQTFLRGVQDNLQTNGVFLFYVPSISVKVARKEQDQYVRFRTNLEHILHFTPEFFENELPKFFGYPAFVQEIKTDFGPSIIGAVAKKSELVDKLRTLFTALVTEKIPPSTNASDLKILAVLALKFGRFDLADEVLKRFKSTKGVNQKDVFLVEGLQGYHSGNLDFSDSSFQSYLQLAPESQFALRSLLYNSTVRSTSYVNELKKLRKLEPKLRATKAQLATVKSELEGTTMELSRLKASRVINPAIKLSNVLGKRRSLQSKFNKSS